MAQSNKGMIAVVGGGCLLGLVLALGYVFYWSPKQKAAEARDEIRAWGVAWSEARSCIVGAEPLSSDAHEAIVARELTDQHVKSRLRQCVPKLKALTRSEGGTTENIAVEKAWFSLQRPVSKLAQAQAWSTAATPNKDGRSLRRNLGVAVTEVEAGYNLLRKGAGMKAASTEGEPLVKTGLYLAIQGPETSEAPVSDLRLRSEAITYTVRTEESLYRASIPAGSKEAQFRALSPLALRAVNADWGLWLEHDGIPMRSHEAPVGATLMSGPLDVQGEPAADGTLLHTLGKDEAASLSFAIGEEKRTALFRIETMDGDSWSLSWAYRLLTSEDAGKTWTERPLPKGEIWVSLREASDNSNIISSEPEDPMALTIMTVTRAGLAEHTVRFPGSRDEMDTWPPDLCQAPNRFWWVVDGSLYSMGGDGRLVAIPGKLEYDSNRSFQFLCGDDYAALHSQSYSESGQVLQYQACSLDRCDKVVRSSTLTSDATLHHVFHQGKWQTIQELDGVVLSWHGAETSAPKELLRLHLEGDLTGVVSWGDTLLFLVWPPDAPGPSLLQAQ